VGIHEIPCQDARSVVEDGIARASRAGVDRVQAYVPRLMGKEAHGRGARHDEVDKLRALEAYEAVSAGDDEHDRHRTNERPQPGQHVENISHSSASADELLNRHVLGRMVCECDRESNLMRIVDFRVGIPLTFCFTVAAGSSASWGSPLHLTAHRATFCSFSSPKWGRWSTDDHRIALASHLSHKALRPGTVPGNASTQTHGLPMAPPVSAAAD
jgi:hypothetical protein